jgi:HK97 family phage major capsid protein
VSIWEDLPDPNGGNFPIAFGDFRRAYLLADRVPMRITVDPYTTAGSVKFYVRRISEECKIAQSAQIACRWRSTRERI